MLRIALVLATVVTLTLAAPVGAEAPSATVDTEMLRWNDEVPGFGGFFYDETGLATVYLLDPANDGAARETFGADVQVRQGAWEFQRLHEWKSQLIPLLSLPGAVLLDIDEELNRLYIGFDRAAENREANRERLEEELRGSGIPREAVVVEETEPVLLAQTLRDKHTPIPGGVHISFGNSFCTVGFNVYRYLPDDFGFITNSHCSLIPGQTEGTVYFQATTPDRVAVEVADPPYFSGGHPDCPPGRSCRYSDALFARYDYNEPPFGDLGSVARTTGRGSATGSLTVASVPFEVTGVDIFPLVGTQVNKIGRTTGWTYGRVVRSCLDVNPSGTNVTLLCQHSVTAGVLPGDSGSPAFRWGTAPRYRQLYTRVRSIEAVGLVWGGTTGSFFFSPILNIEGELGRLVFY